MKNIILSGIFLLFTNVAVAAFIPFGVRNDVATSEVTTWGYTEIYRGNYSENFNLLTVLDGVDTNAKVMLAGYKNGSTAYDVLASASLSEVLQITGQNQTHLANGVQWYRNDQSLGFAGLGDLIFQDSADICGAGQGVDCNDKGLVERDRLSWHTTDGSDIFGGWRSGSNIELSDSEDWQRVILATSSTNPPPPAVPVPGAFWLFSSTLMGLAALGRRKV